MCRDYPELTQEAVAHLNLAEIDVEKNPLFKCVKCGRFLSWSHSKTSRLSPKKMKKTAYFKCSNSKHGELLYFYNYEWEDPF